MIFFSENAKYLRLNAGLSQAEIAASIGISRTTWVGYESGLSQPNISGLLKIVEFFDITTSDLLERDLQNVHLNKNELAENQAEYVHLNVHPNVHLKGKKGVKSECIECEKKDVIISADKQLLQSKTEQIEQQKQIIQLLQNQIDQMKIEVDRQQQNPQPQQKERKTA